jgi:hypothetical protein
MFNPLATNGNNPPSRYWRNLVRHQTPKAPNSHRCLELHISLTPRRLPCLSLHMLPTLKSLRCMSLLMKRTPLHFGSGVRWLRGADLNRRADLWVMRSDSPFGESRTVR